MNRIGTNQLAFLLALLLLALPLLSYAHDRERRHGGQELPSWAIPLPVYRQLDAWEQEKARRSGMAVREDGVIYDDDTECHRIQRSLWDAAENGQQSMIRFYEKSWQRNACESMLPRYQPRVWMR